MIHEIIMQWLRQEMGTTVDHVDYDTPLFELAIDSLGVATIAAELERKSQKTMNPDVLYELETINELAEYLDSLPANSAAVKDADSTAVDLESTERGVFAEKSSHVADPLAHYRRLNRRVNSLKEQGLYFFEPVISEHDGAWVVADGQRMLMLGSYEYLGLLGHAHLKDSAIAAIQEFGTGHHGVRLLAGTTTVHRKLEAKLAEFMKAQDAVVYSSGYVTNLSTISALVGPGDCVIGDQWNHASIVDGCRMSGAKFLEFQHNEMDSLAEELGRARGHRTLVVVDAVYSMDGDIADMPAIVRICRQHGALLMVDEAHSLGVLGKTGHGVQEHFGLAPGDVDVKMGTLSKTFAGCGGFVAGREEITSFLRHHARGYIFSGALPAGQTQVAIAALEVLEREPELVARLWENVERYLSGLKSLGFDTAKSVTPIVPVMTKIEKITLEMTRICRSEGLLAVPVAYPAVPLDAPRLRTCVSAIHSAEDIDFALDVLARAGRRCGLIA
jgi:glycine C-acetyltransferase